MRLATVVFALCFESWIAAGSARATGVDWQPGTVAGALGRAQAEKKLVLVDLYATWCVPCQQMDSDVYAREEVARAIAAGYIALRRDGEIGEGLEIVNRYHASGFPTVLVLDQHGVEIDRVMGALTTNEMIQTLARIRDGKGTLADLERALVEAPTDPLRYEVGVRHALRADMRAISELNAVVAADPINNDRRAAAAMLALGKFYYLRGVKDYTRAEATLVELERRFPASFEAQQVPYQRALVKQQSGKPKEAHAILDAWIARAPKDSERYAGYAWFCFKDGGDRARGIEMAKKGLFYDIQNDALWDTLGELYAATGDRVEARKAFSKAAELAPKNEYYQKQLHKVGGPQ